MKRKSWLFPIATFIVFFSMLFLYQNSQNIAPSVTITETDTPTLWTLMPNNIKKLCFSSAHKKIVINKEDSNWILTNYNNKPADEVYIYTALRYFINPTFESIVETNASNLGDYGITEFSPMLTITDTSGKNYSLVKGHSIDDALDYVYSPSNNTIYKMSSVAFDTLSSDVKSWRNKQILSFNLEDASKIDLWYKNIEATIVPVSTNQQMSFTSSDINDRLTSEFIKFLKNSRIEEFITDEASPSVLEVYGFNNPLLTCNVYLKDNTTFKLTIGSINTEKNICYAMVNGDNHIVTIPCFDFSTFDMVYASLQ